MVSDDRPVVVDLQWSEPPALRVEATDEGLRVIAHPGLSEAQVREACNQLDGDGDRVFRAWQGAVGRS
jgi:hypothetical protein